MGAIGRSKFGRQPPEPVGLNWGHPLAGGIAFAAASHGGVLRDYVSGRLPASGTGTRSDGVYQFGKARRYSAGSDFFTTQASMDAPTSYSWLVRAKWVSFSSFSGVFTKTANLGTNNGWGTFSNSGATELYVSHSSGFSTSLDNPATLAGIGVCNIVVVWDGANVHWYRDGKLITLSVYGAAVTSGNGYVKIASNRDTHSSTCWHDHTIVWPGRVLSPGEATFLSTGGNSYELFRAPQIWVPVSVGGGGSWSVSLTESASASDSLAAATTALVSLIESASAADIIGAATIAAVALTEAASASDTQTASYSATGSGSVTESASASDTLDAANTMLRALTETASADDQLAAATTMLRAISESASASDDASASYTAAGAAAITETASATDALTAAATLLVTILEAGSATDALAAATTMVRAITEQATAADEVAASQPIIASVSITELATAIDVLIGELAGGAWVAGDGLMSKPRIGMARNGDLYSLVLDDDGIPVACKRMGTSRLLKLRALPGGNQAQVMVETGVVLVVL